MGVTLIEERGEGPLEVVIAGGGVAGLEALLARHELAGPRVRVELLALEREFVYRPLAVAEPFRLAHPARIDLPELAARHGARHRRDSLASVDPVRRSLHTKSGRRLRYDALLLAIGAVPVEAVHGALTFRGPADVEAFGGLLEELARGCTAWLSLRTTASGGRCRSTSSPSCRLRISSRVARATSTGS